MLHFWITQEERKIILQIILIRIAANYMNFYVLYPASLNFKQPLLNFPNLIQTLTPSLKLTQRFPGYSTSNFLKPLISLTSINQINTLLYSPFPTSSSALPPPFPLQPSPLPASSNISKVTKQTSQQQSKKRAGEAISDIFLSWP